MFENAHQHVRGEKMKRSIQTLLILVMALPLAGCALVRVVNLTLGAKTLTMEPNKIVFCGIQGDTLRFEIPLTLHNHCKGQARVKQIQINASIADHHVFATSHNEELNIEPDAELQLAIPIDIKLANIAKGILAGSPVFDFNGKATVDFGVLGKRVISFNVERRIFSPTKSRISLKNISLGKSDLAALRLTMVFDRTEDPDNKVIGSSLSGFALISGIHVGTLTQLREGAQIEAEVAIPVFSALGVTKQIAKTKTLSAKISVLYEADTNRIKYRIPYVFEIDGITFAKKIIEHEN
jgi:hypothetical protein